MSRRRILRLGAGNPRYGWAGGDSCISDSLTYLCFLGRFAIPRSFKSVSNRSGVLELCQKQSKLEILKKTIFSAFSDSTSLCALPPSGRCPLARSRPRTPSRWELTVNSITQRVLRVRSSARNMLSGALPSAIVPLRIS